MNSDKNLEQSILLSSSNSLVFFNCFKLFSIIFTLNIMRQFNII